MNKEGSARTPKERENALDRMNRMPRMRDMVRGAIERRINRTAQGNSTENTPSHPGGF